MTVHEKRKFELMVRAGGKTIPYTAPVYNGYKETFQGLKSQGWRAFYKGLGWRAGATFAYLLPFSQISGLISTEDVQKGSIYQYMKLWLTCFAFDVLLNPLHIL